MLPTSTICFYSEKMHKQRHANLNVCLLMVLTWICICQSSWNLIIVVDLLTFQANVHWKLLFLILFQISLLGFALSQVYISSCSPHPLSSIDIKADIDYPCWHSHLCLAETCTLIEAKSWHLLARRDLVSRVGGIILHQNQTRETNGAFPWKEQMVYSRMLLMFLQLF